jgi:enoyl-CoA hydratase/carnithine racemase
MLNVQRDRGAMVLEIDRPDDNNRIDMATMGAMSAAITAAEQDRAIRALIITGKGGYFCEGGRIDGYPTGTTLDQLEYARAFTVLQERMARARMPIVGAVNGHCFAGGMSLLEACDIAIAVETAEFGYPEIRGGLMPMLAIAVARNNLPPKLAFDLFYTGRRMTADEALAMHLVNRVVPADALWTEVFEVVGALAANSAAAMMVGRQAFYAMGNMSKTSALEYGHTALIAMLNAARDEKAAS